PRSKAVNCLANLLDHYGVVHVRGAPASGKTTLAKLLYLPLKRAARRVVFIKEWEGNDDDDASDYLAKECHKRGYKQVEASTIENSDLIFIIDEAQLTYDFSNLWSTLIK
ncbi:hypothetical protein V8E54_013683, partial [Elaphomyces granulatus]